MTVIYIREQGSYIRLVSERIFITKGETTVLEIPIAEIDSIALFGSIQITTQAVERLMLSGVDISYFTYSGKFIGQTAADRSKNIFLRLSQYQLYNDVNARLKIGRIITANKVKNQIEVIRHHRWGESEYDWNRDICKLQELSLKLEDAANSNEIMGIEGMCSNVYFSAFGQMFHSDFVFNGRNRRPPKDPINILISLGYTFLARDVSSVLDSQSFEMYLGLLHGIRYGRKSLPLDIMEEFRQPFVDLLVIRICNLRIISSFDFEEEGDRVSLTEDGFKKFCREYEKRITGATGGVNYRGIMKRQAARLKSAIMDKTEYQPYAAYSEGGENNDTGEL
jgi:CRISPR-associated protein Cas1